MGYRMFNPFRWPFRAQCFAGFIVCIALLAYAYFVQFQLGIEPCPLCMFQRVAFVAIALVFLVGTFHSPGRVGAWIYAILLFLASAAGAVAASQSATTSARNPSPRSVSSVSTSSPRS